MTPHIRNIAAGLVVRDGRVLAAEHAVIPGHHRFVRAIGGGIEFGERAEHALRREFRAELGVELSSVELLAVTENLFVTGPAVTGCKQRSGSGRDRPARSGSLFVQ